MNRAAFIYPGWPVHYRVKSLITTCHSPISELEPSLSVNPYADFNLAKHVGDNAEQVELNRQSLVQAAELPSQPIWLNQVHGINVRTRQNPIVDADAIYSTEARQVCTVMTADCLPVLLASESGDEVAAIHAGWRGLLAGVIESTVQQFQTKAIQAYLGPAIGPENFQVGAEVREAFVKESGDAQSAFLDDEEGKYKMNIYQLAMQNLKRLGIKHIYGGEYCTYAEKRFYSYRQACHQSDGQTGRMASLIWIED